MDELVLKDTQNSVASEPNPQATADVTILEGKAKDALQTIYDPEIPINIYELGLIYELQVEPTGQVNIQMTLTAPACPEAGVLPSRVEDAVKAVPGVTGASVELVGDPPWTPHRM